MGKGNDPNCTQADQTMNIMEFAATTKKKKTSAMKALEAIEPEQFSEITGEELPGMEDEDAEIPAADLEPITRPGGEEYHPRSSPIPGMTDVKFLRECREGNMPVLLSGYPGTGKTAMIEAAFGGDMRKLNAHGRMTMEDLVGSYVAVEEVPLRVQIASELADEAKLSKKDRELLLEAARQLPSWGEVPQPVQGPAGELIKALSHERTEGGDLIISAEEGNQLAGMLSESWRRAGTTGKYVWEDGPLVEAMKEGRVLFIDDITLAPPEVLARLYPVMDGSGGFKLEEHEREEIEPAEGFMIVGAHNPGVVGAVLSTPLSSRFAATPTVSTSYDLAGKLGVNRRVARGARNMQGRRDRGEILWAPEMRDLLQFQDMADRFGGAAAAEAMIAKVEDPGSRDALIEVLEPIFPVLKKRKLREPESTVFGISDN